MLKKGQSQRELRDLKMIRRLISGEGLNPDKRMNAKDGFKAALYLEWREGRITIETVNVFLSGAPIQQSYAELAKTAEVGKDAEKYVENLQKKFLEGDKEE